MDWKRGKTIRTELCQSANLRPWSRPALSNLKTSWLELALLAGFRNFVHRGTFTFGMLPWMCHILIRKSVPKLICQRVLLQYEYGGGRAWISRLLLMATQGSIRYHLYSFYIDGKFTFFITYYQPRYSQFI